MSKIGELQLTAAKCRQNALRMVKASGHGHIGGAFSCMDIVTTLYFYKMNIDPLDPKKEDRDRFLLSAGHKCLAQYAVLAERGYFPKEMLDTYGQLHCKLPGHPDMYKLNGIEANTGALGHGLSIASGMAMGMKLSGFDSNVYVVMGDGELAEGSNWEAAAAAAHHGLDNLILFVDYNGLQISGNVKDVMNFTPIGEHFAGFGWEVMEIDGNNIEEIINAVDHCPKKEGKPTVIVAHTVKCKGFSKGEGKAAYHFWNPSPDELKQAETEIEEQIERLKEK